MLTTRYLADFAHTRQKLEALRRVKHQDMLQEGSAP